MNDLALLIEAEVCLEKMIERADSVQDEGPEGRVWKSNELKDEIRTSIEVLNKLKRRIKGGANGRVEREAERVLPEAVRRIAFGTQDYQQLSAGREA